MQSSSRSALPCSSRTSTSSSSNAPANASRNWSSRNSSRSRQNRAQNTMPWPATRQSSSSTRSAPRSTRPAPPEDPPHSFTHTLTPNPQAIFDELVALVDPGDDAPPAFNVRPPCPFPPPTSPPPALTPRPRRLPTHTQPVKGKTQVIMMVGLQGAGKTTTCTKVRPSPVPPLFLSAHLGMPR